MIIAPIGEPRGLVAFSPGAGGDPARYAVLLEAAAAAGYLVTAPSHERFEPRTASDEQVRERATGLADAIAETGRDDLPVIVAGHSIGGWAALCLGGAQPWGRNRQPIPVPIEPRTTRIVAIAPTLGWFQAPGALDQLRSPVTVLAGSEDTVTPAATADILRASPGELRVHVYEGVGHLDFMSTLPPGIQHSAGLDHEAFLGMLARDFVAALEGGV